MKKLTTALGLALMTSLPAAALAAPIGPYAGLSIGHAETNLDAGSAGEIDAGTHALSAFAGYRIHEYFGAEIGYTYFGDYKIDLPGSRSDLDLYGFTAHVTGHLPISNNVELFGKVGLIHWDTKISHGGPSDDGTDLAAGLGFAAYVNQNVSLRGEWNYYKIDPSGYDADTSVFSVGAAYHF